MHKCQSIDFYIYKTIEITTCKLPKGQKQNSNNIVTYLKLEQV